MTDELDEINQILMCFEKYSWKEFGEHYPVTNQKSMNRTEAKQAIQALIDQECTKARIDEQTHTQADIDGNIEYWPDGVTVMSQLERLAELSNKENK